MCQPGVMKNPVWMLLAYLWLQQFQTNLWCIAGSIILGTIRECVLAGALIVNGPIRSTQTLHDPGVNCQVSLFWVGAAHISCVHAPSLSFDILDKWNINNPCSTSCVRQVHFMVFLKVLSVLVCPG
jgi:hypothetical protein